MQETTLGAVAELSCYFTKKKVGKKEIKIWICREKENSSEYGNTL